MTVRVGLLYRSGVDIDLGHGQTLTIRIPSVGEVLKCEDEYYSIVHSLTAMPVDMIVLLDDHGIDFSKINEYQLFIFLFGAIMKQDTKLIFGDFCFDGFEFAIDEKTGQPVYLDRKRDLVIDRTVQYKIADALRKIHHLEKNLRKPGNEEARKYMIERARKKMARNRRRKKDSELERLIVAMVNTEQYKYDFEGTKNLSIYQFNESVRQVIKKVDYSNKMFGVYSGTINPKDLNQDDLNWLIHK